MPNAKELKYTKTHEWVFIQGDTALCGLTEYAQSEIGDIVFIELPKAGAAVSKGKNCAVIESVKAASDFYAPISGTVAEVNDKIVAEPSLVNQSAQENGWFFKIKISDPSEAGDLMDAQAYAKFVEAAKSAH